MVAGEEFDFTNLYFQNHLQQGSAQPLVPHDTGEDEVVSDVQVLPAFEGSDLFFHAILRKIKCRTAVHIICRCGAGVFMHFCRKKVWIF